jgi:hypothetical protein
VKEQKGSQSVDTPTPAILHFRFSIFTGIKKSGKYFGSSQFFVQGEAFCPRLA